jgi:hypothetical protein
MVFAGLLASGRFLGQQIKQPSYENGFVSDLGQFTNDDVCHE